MEIKVLGFRGNIDSVSKTLDKINSFKNSDDEIIQLLNADAIAGLRHVEHGVNQAFLAFRRHENLANDLSVEICLRCSAQRQISKAFEILAFSVASAFAESIIFVSRVEYLGESARSGFSMPNFSTASNFDVGESSCSMEAMKESAAVSLWFCFQEA